MHETVVYTRGQLCVNGVRCNTAVIYLKFAGCLVAGSGVCDGENVVRRDVLGVTA